MALYTLSSRISLFVLILLPLCPYPSFALKAFNAIDRCWREDLNWSNDRQHLAMCSAGFVGKMTKNVGKNLKFYEVTNPTDDPIDPKPGSIRYGVTKFTGPLWITFRKDMNIKLKMPLVIGSYTTIDGRGSKVHVFNGPCFFLSKVTNVIIHSILFHQCKPWRGGAVMGPGSKLLWLGTSDGDAIRVTYSTKVWIDHNTLFKCFDGLIDVTLGSTWITISNNRFRDHDAVMLLGHADDYKRDRNMKVTVAFNHFGPNCNQRMPRVRWGYAHVVNNYYEGWKQYAIGGSSNPNIKSESNYFVTGSHFDNEEVSHQIEGVNNKKWNIRSVGDYFENGSTTFTEYGDMINPNYSRDQAFRVADAKSVKNLTRSSGALRCVVGVRC